MAVLTHAFTLHSVNSDSRSSDCQRTAGQFVPLASCVPRPRLPATRRGFLSCFLSQIEEVGGTALSLFADHERPESRVAFWPFPH